MDVNTLLNFPDERCLIILIDKTSFELCINATGYHARPVTPSTTDFASYKTTFFLKGSFPNYINVGW